MKCKVRVLKFIEIEDASDHKNPSKALSYKMVFQGEIYGSPTDIVSKKLDQTRHVFKPKDIIEITSLTGDFTGAIDIYTCVGHNQFQNISYFIQG